LIYFYIYIIFFDSFLIYLKTYRYFCIVKFKQQGGLYMRFTKMHGAGNDYIYVNGFTEQVENPAELSIRLSNRNFGVGSDGLVLILPSETCDFRMRMFNADGSESEMCGNASRCVGKYVYDKGLTQKTEINLETGAGVKILKLEVSNGKVKRVTVDMGEPILQPALVPVNLPGEKAVSVPLIIENSEYAITCVSMGNPHAVVFTKGIDQLNLTELGPKFENNALFPRRTNTEFIEILDRSTLKMRVWERGSGETLACGTGACASLVAAVLNGHTERKATLQLLGGTLEIEWDEKTNHVFMTGPAETVFEGELINE
jgi:diaminopimelate epimerase